jgi:hypothetical protein
MKLKNKKAVIEPINLIIAFVAFVGVVSFLANQPNYGLVFLIISTLIEAIARLVR